MANWQLNENIIGNTIEIKMLILPFFSDYVYIIKENDHSESLQDLLAAHPSEIQLISTGNIAEISQDGIS